MLEIRTFYSKFHRPVKKIASGFSIKSGMWAYLDSNGTLTNIATTSDDQLQPKTLKMVISGQSSDSNYENHDMSLGKVSIVELPVSAAVDSDGYQKYDTLGNLITYNEGQLLTVAFRVTSTASADDRYGTAGDIGKLRPAYAGDIVVGEVIRLYNGYLEFRSVTPRSLEGDSEWEIRGRGALTDSVGTLTGEGDHTPLWQGFGDLSAGQPEVSGVGDHTPLYSGSGSLPSSQPTASGAGTQTPSGPPAGPDRGAYEY